MSTSKRETDPAPSRIACPPAQGPENPDKLNPDFVLYVADRAAHKWHADALGDCRDAAASEAKIALLKNAHRILHAENPDGMAFTIASRGISQAWRTYKRHAAPKGSEVPLDTIVELADFDLDARLFELRLRDEARLRLVEAAMSLLTEEENGVLTYRCNLLGVDPDLPDREIGRRLGIQTRQVGRLWKRAIAILREAVGISPLKHLERSETGELRRKVPKKRSKKEESATYCNGGEKCDQLNSGKPIPQLAKVCFSASESPAQAGM